MNISYLTKILVLVAIVLVGLVFILIGSSYNVVYSNNGGQSTPMADVLRSVGLGGSHMEIEAKGLFLMFIGAVFLSAAPMASSIVGELEKI